MYSPHTSILVFFPQSNDRISLAKSDAITCNSNTIEFVSKFTYLGLGVVFQTKGKLTGHFDHLRNKGIAACAKVAARMPLSKMSPAILARIFLAVFLPSATYGLRSMHTNETLDFLDEVQGRTYQILVWCF